MTNDGVYIDVSDVTQRFVDLESVLSPKRFQKVIFRTVSDTAKYVKTIVGKETQKQYVTTQKAVKADIGGYTIHQNAATAGSDAAVSCSIPLNGVKGVIGVRYKAKGGTGKPVKGKRQIIRASIVRSGQSELPPVMKNQGGNPPFRSPKTRVVYTRKTEKRLPIVRVVALASPQFPPNRSENDVVDAINQRMLQRFMHYAGLEFSGKQI